MNSRKSASDAHPAWGWLCIALGFYPIAIAFDWLPVDPGDVHAPPWVLAMCGVIFVAAGCQILLGGRGQLQHLFGTIIISGFALIGMWVALLSSDDGFSGGLFFLSHDANITLGRWMFGIGALISLAILALAWYLYHRGDD